ncbi:MAG: 2-hydroxychromene-2-carboxylate isomerase [Alphaproteobacteria bacterium]|nr:2-hydroxychromene-2-carboxylate isomerase [Alphaproteobacteria bacterium]MCW5744407.1 2-hydroxychromene-2-carboxylate isomerase [Alphaproteobacteria bacterium]
MPARLEFFFDCSSPWTYLAFHAVQPLAAEFGVAIEWRPILVGGVFNAVNDTVYQNRANPNPRKAGYMLKDLADWARLHGLRIRMPPSVFPVNSVKCMRGALVAMERDLLVPYATAVFEAYWGEDLDISQDAAIEGILARVSLDRAEFFARIAEQACKDRLKANTDELIARGGFGSPTIYINGTDMYFGNDRLPLVRAALQHAA